jgi:hypothetical protein
MPGGKAKDKSRRDSGSKPRVARQELPWEKWAKANNPNGAVALLRTPDETPLVLKTVAARNPG